MANNPELDQLAEAAFRACFNSTARVFTDQSESYKDRWREVAMAVIAALPDTFMGSDVKGPAMAWVVISSRPPTEADHAWAKQVAQRRLNEETGS